VWSLGLWIFSGPSVSPANIRWVQILTSCNIDARPNTMPLHSPPTPGVSPVHAGFLPSRPNSSSNSASNSASSPRSAPSATSDRTSVSTSPSVSGSQLFPPLSMPPTGSFSPPSERPKHRKQRLFNVDRKRICELHLENPDLRQEDIASRYNVERSTISKILKNKIKWLNVPASESLGITTHRYLCFYFFTLHFT
jgi:hypothetical protein